MSFRAKAKNLHIYRFVKILRKYPQDDY